MTERELRDASVDYKLAAREAEEFRGRRDKAVREALAAGWTHARIAEVAGLTRGRIGQMAQSSRSTRST